MAFPLTFNGPSMRLIGCPVIVAMASVLLRSVRERAAERALRQFDLEVVVPAARGAGHRRLSGSPVRGHRGGSARQRRFGLLRAPRLMRDAAERDAGGSDRSPLGQI